MHYYSTSAPSGPCKVENSWLRIFGPLLSVEKNPLEEAEGEKLALLGVFLGICRVHKSWLHFYQNKHQTTLHMLNFHDVIFNCHIPFTTTASLIAGVTALSSEVGTWEGPELAVASSVLLWGCGDCHCAGTYSALLGTQPEVQGAMALDQSSAEDKDDGGVWRRNSSASSPLRGEKMTMFHSLPEFSRKVELLWPTVCDDLLSTGCLPFCFTSTLPTSRFLDSPLRWFLPYFFVSILGNPARTTVYQEVCFHDRPVAIAIGRIIPRLHVSDGLAFCFWVWGLSLLVRSSQSLSNASVSGSGGCTTEQCKSLMSLLLTPSFVLAVFLSEQGQKPYVD